MVLIHEAYPHLRVHSTAEAVDFYARAFDARELFRLTEPGGRIGHAEIKLGPTTLMLADEYPEHGIFRASLAGRDDHFDSSARRERGRGIRPGGRRRRLGRPAAPGPILR